jgi:AraC family transcriptional regulator
MGLLSTEVFRMQDIVDAGPVGLSSAQCGKIAAYVEDHISERLSPADVARVVGLSSDYFTRVFRRTFGVPPRAWLLQRRIRHAANQLADTSLSVSELAYRLGYDDPCLFSRQFKSVMGASPRSFRKTVCADEDASSP